MPIGLSHQEYRIDSQIGHYLYGDKSRYFESRIINADVVISGFQLKYEEADHHVAEVEVYARWTQNMNDGPDEPHVLFEVHANLADRDGNDPYSGFVNVLVIAELE